MIGDRIKELRENQGLSQEKFAERIGVQRNTVWRWENKKANPDLIAIEKIAKVFEISKALLLGETFDASLPVNNSSPPLHCKREVARLVYERPNGERLDLPDTPENRELFEKLVVAMMTDSLKKESSALHRSGGIAQSA